MKLSHIYEGRILRVPELENTIHTIQQLIDQKAATWSKEPSSKVLLGYFDLAGRQTPVYWCGTAWMRQEGIPYGAIAAFYPENWMADNPPFRSDRGLHIFPSFMQAGKTFQKHVLHHELIHGVDPKIELEKHQREAFLGPVASEAEFEANISPKIYDIANKAKNNPRYLQKILTALRAGNLSAIDPFFSRIPSQKRKQVLTKVYNALADAGSFTYS